MNNLIYREYADRVIKNKLPIAPKNTTIQVKNKPSIRINLNDPNERARLTDKYQKYDDPFPSVVTIASFWAHLFVVTKTNGANPDALYLDKGVYTRSKNNPTIQTYESAYEFCFKQLANPTSFFKQKENDVETRIMLPPIIFAVDLRDNKERNTIELKKFEQTIKKLIPDFSVSTNWNKSGNTSNNKLLLSVENIKESPRLRIEKFEKTEFPREYNTDKFKVSNFEVEEDYKKETPGLLEVAFMLNNEGCYFKPYTYDEPDSDVKSGNIYGRSGYYVIEIIPVIYFIYPHEYALFATDSDSFNDFIPKNFVNRLNMALAGEATETSNYPTCVGNFKRVYDNNTQKKNLGIKAKERVNKENLTILKNGTICYVDSGINNINKYRDFINEAYDPITSTVLQNKDIKSIHNMPIYVDWYNNKIVYCNAEGTINTIDLAGCLPLDDVTIHRWLNMELDLVGDLDPFFKIVHKYAQEFNLYDEEKVNKNFRMRSILEMLQSLKDEDDQPRIRDLYSKKMSDSLRERKLPERIEYLEEIARILEGVYKRIDDMKEAYSSKIEFYIPYFIIMTKYAKEEVTFSKAYSEEYLKNTARPVSKDRYVIPNVPGLTSLMPHQAEASDELDFDSKNDILSIDAGGGKSILYVSNILKKIHKGLIKRPLVVCPGNLAKQVYSECAAIGKNMINCFIIKQTTIDHMLSSEGTDFDSVNKLISYIKKMPPNTIFVTTYEFLRGKRNLWTNKVETTIPYGETSVRSWPNVEFLNQCEFDYIINDEGHKLRNLSSSMSQAVSMVRSNIDRMSLASGTVITKNAVDLVGQLGIINPKIVGDKQQFMERFTDNGGILNIGAENYIQKAMTPYVRKISKKKKDWAFLLPKINEQFYQVYFTDNQQKFYNNLIAQALEDIRKELGSLAKKGDDNEEEAERIENALRKHLQPVEKFISAPDSNEAFKNLITSKGNDLISPKVAMTNKIIKAHFYGNSEMGIMADKSDANKVIVFCYHLDAVNHIYDHLEMKNIALLYHAGDEETYVKFRDDPKYKILVAAETSLREGFNMQFCFPGDTYVLTDKGTAIKIKDIYRDKSITHVLSYDLKNKRIEKKKIKKRMRFKVKSSDNYVMISIKDQHTKKTSSFVCTDNHSIFRRDGSEILAGELKKGDQLITYGGKYNNCEKTKIGYIGGKELLTYKKSKNTTKQWKNPEFKELMEKVAERDKEARSRVMKRTSKKINTKEHRKKLSKRMKERWKNQKYRNFMAKSLQDWLKTEEYQEFLSVNKTSKKARKKWSKIHKKLWKNKKRREEASKLMRKLWSDPKYREKLSRALKKAYSTPEMKKLLSKQSKKIWKNNYNKMIKAFIRGQNNPKVRIEKSKRMKKLWKNTDFRENTIKSMRTTLSTRKARKLKSITSKEVWKSYSNPKKDKILKSLLKGQGIFPNRPEKAIINMKIPNLKYTGDGKYYITLNIDGKNVRKNPDFVYLRGKRLRTAKVVEVIGARKYTNRNGHYDRKLVNAYKKVGVDCLIIDDKKIYEEPKKVEARIQSHINNHYLTVTKVVRLKNDNKRIGKYKYDIEVLGNHNYFISTYHERKTIKSPVLVHNCSRAISEQQPWNPGDLEQKLARIFRPDPRGKYNRAFINHDLLVTNNSMEIAKSARLISRVVDKAKIDEVDNPDWKGIKDQFSKMELIRMNLDFITQFTNFESLSPYFDNYAKYKEWEDQQFEVSKRRLQAKLQDKLGKKIPIEDLAKYAMIPVDGTKVIEGSKKAYVPWVAGIEIHDEHNLGLQPISSLQSEQEDEGDDSKNLDTNKEVTEGDLAVTEFGPGKITKIHRSSVKVKIPAIGNKEIKLHKTVVFVPTNEGGEKKLKEVLKTVPNSNKMFNDNVGKPRLIDKPKEEIKKKKVIEKEEPKTKKEKIAEKPSIELYVSTINDQPALSTYTDKAGARPALKLGWREIPDFYAMHVRNMKGMASLITKLNAKFAISPKRLSQIMELSNKMKSGKGKLLQTDPLNLTEMKNFFRLQHTTITKAKGSEKQEIKPFPLIWEGEVHLCFNIGTHPSSVFPKLKRIQSTTPGVSSEMYKGMIINFFKSKKEAISDFYKLKKFYNIEEPDKQILSEINQLQLFGKKRTT